MTGEGAGLRLETSKTSHQQLKSGTSIILFTDIVDSTPLTERMGDAAFRALSRWREAIAAYQRSLALNPDFPDAHVNLGGLLIERGEFAAAMPHYHRAVELRPDSAVVHNNYASALASIGRYQDALQHVRRALEIRPGYPPALENLGRLERMGIR